MHNRKDNRTNIALRSSEAVPVTIAEAFAVMASPDPIAAARALTEQRSNEASVDSGETQKETIRRLREDWGADRVRFLARIDELETALRAVARGGPRDRMVRIAEEQLGLEPSEPCSQEATPNFEAIAGKWIHDAPGWRSVMDPVQFGEELEADTASLAKLLAETFAAGRAPCSDKPLCKCEPTENGTAWEGCPKHDPSHKQVSPTKTNADAYRKVQQQMRIAALAWLNDPPEDADKVTSLTSLLRRAWEEGYEATAHAMDYPRHDDGLPSVLAGNAATLERACVVGWLEEQGHPDLAERVDMGEHVQHREDDAPASDSPPTPEKP